MGVRWFIRTACVAWGFVAVGLVAGCEADTLVQPQVLVSVAPPTADLMAGGRQDFTASVTNDIRAKGVVWSVTNCAGGAALCGTLSRITSTTATYTAPNPIPSTTQVSVTATSAIDHTHSFTVPVALAAIGVSVSPSSVTIAASATQLLTALVTNDPLNRGVTWGITGCSGGVSGCGGLSNLTSTTATYSAPAVAPPGTVGVTATSVTDKNQSWTTPITIILAATVVPTITGVDVGTALPLTATVAGDAANLGVVWTLTGAGCTGADCGSLSTSVSASGEPITYTAPTVAPSPAAVTVTATPVANPSRAGSATLVITSPGVVAVWIVPATAVLRPRTSRQFTAWVFNGPSSDGVTWTASSGSLSSNASGSGIAVTYTAPTTTGVVTLTARSATDTTKSAQARVSVVVPRRP